MKPGKFFKQWFNHRNTFFYGYDHFYNTKKAFEKGREYEKKYGSGQIHHTRRSNDPYEQQ